MPDLGFLFGADRAKEQANRAAGVTCSSHDLTFRRSPQQHSKPTSPSLDLALQNSARSSLDNSTSSPLIESSPISFAPAMSAPPGGFS